MIWLALLVLACLASLLLAPKLKPRQSEELSDPALIIKPPVYRFTGSDEALAARTRKRREIADAIRHRAGQVESGAKSADVLRLIRK